jgi:hypothetical protein
MASRAPFFIILLVGADFQMYPGLVFIPTGQKQFADTLKRAGQSDK